MPVWTWAAVVALTAAGCTARRPAELPFRDPVAGLEFDPPSGWSLRAAAPDAGIPGAVVPPRRGSGAVLARYRRLMAGESASLELVEQPLARPLSAGACLNYWAPGRDWTRVGPAEGIEIGGRAAARAQFRRTRGGKSLSQETTLVVEGGRAFIFTGTFRAEDEKARDQVRASVASVRFGLRRGIQLAGGSR